MKVPEIMKYAGPTLFVLLLCTGCDRGQSSSKRSVTEDMPLAATSEQYPQLEWTEPLPEPDPGTPSIIGAHGGAAPVNVTILQSCFNDSRWTDAKNPEFTLSLTENDFFRITIAPDSGKMVGTVKTTRTIDSGSRRVEVSQVAIRTTQQFANEGEALSLLEAYLKQDGTFESLVRWADADTGDSNADAGARR